jgi:hypothetical protein
MHQIDLLVQRALICMLIANLTYKFLFLGYIGFIHQEYGIWNDPRNNVIKRPC